MATNPESGAFRRILFAAGPHVLALALFAVLSVLFYGKVYDGYALKQPDIANWKGMYQEIADNQILTGEGTNWTGSLFGGMPTYQIGGAAPRFSISQAICGSRYTGCSDLGTWRACG